MDDNKTVPVNMSKYDFPIMEQNITATQAVYRASVVSVGIFLNSVVLIVVSLSRQLHYPRHIFWAAVSIFECLFLVDSALELDTVHNRDYLACRFVVLLYPGDYSILLICLALAAFDRYISIARYEWYMVNATNRGVIILISIVVVVTFVIFTSPYWTGYKSIYSCTANIIHSHWAFVWNTFLGIVCVILHIKIFFETKNLIRQYVPEYRRAPYTVKFAVTSSIQQPSISSNVIIQFNFICSLIIVIQLNDIFPSFS
jgi:5-hydroxytryptamine receptor 1